MIFVQDFFGVQEVDIVQYVISVVGVFQNMLGSWVDLQVVSEIVIGVEGMLIFYFLRIDDGLVMILLGCFFVFVYVLVCSKKFLL